MMLSITSVLTLSYTSACKRFIFLLWGLSFILLSCKDKTANAAPLEDRPWAQVKHIINTIGTIAFPADTLNVLDFGVVSDTTVLSTSGFRAAVTQCSEAGGGVVRVPEGRYLTGPIHLEDNVNLYLEEGAEIFFSKDPKAYYPLVRTSWEGTELMNYSPLIYAYRKKNIAVTGKGVLNGQAGNTTWWPWCGKKEYGWKEGTPSQRDTLNRPRLVEMAASGKPVAERIFGERHYLRPTFIEPFECEGVLIEGIKIVNAPFWIIHPIKCNRVIVDGVTVESHGPNNDGCDPEYSKNVLIQNCTFNTGDDCIAIKSGRNEDGRSVAIKSENIVVRNCNMIDGHGGVVMGSEISAGVKNVFVEDCRMNSSNLDRAIRIKTNSKRGGITEHIYVRNVEVGQVKEAVLKINMFYNIHGNQTGDHIPVVRNITLENITVKDGGQYGILARGYEESPIKNVLLKNVVIERADSAYSLKNVENLRFINTYINGNQMKNVTN